MYLTFPFFLKPRTTCEKLSFSNVQIDIFNYKKSLLKKLIKMLTFVFLWSILFKLSQKKHLM